MVRRSGLGKGLGALIPPTLGRFQRVHAPARCRSPGSDRTPIQPRNQFGEQGLVHAC